MRRSFTMLFGKKNRLGTSSQHITCTYMPAKQAGMECRWMMRYSNLQHTGSNRGRRANNGAPKHELLYRVIPRNSKYSLHATGEQRQRISTSLETVNVTHDDSHRHTVAAENDKKIQNKYSISIRRTNSSHGASVFTYCPVRLVGRNSNMHFGVGNCACCGRLSGRITGIYNQDAEIIGVMAPRGNPRSRFLNDHCNFKVEHAEHAESMTTRERSEGTFIQHTEQIDSKRSQTFGYGSAKAHEGQNTCLVWCSLVSAFMLALAVAYVRTRLQMSTRVKANRSNSKRSQRVMRRFITIHDIDSERSQTIKHEIVEIDDGQNTCLARWPFAHGRTRHHTSTREHTDHFDSKRSQIIMYRIAKTHASS